MEAARGLRRQGRSGHGVGICGVGEGWSCNAGILVRVDLAVCCVGDVQVIGLRGSHRRSSNDMRPHGAAPRCRRTSRIDGCLLDREGSDERVDGFDPVFS
jgi:hypothetical protein